MGVGGNQKRGNIGHVKAAIEGKVGSDDGNIRGKPV